MHRVTRGEPPALLRTRGPHYAAEFARKRKINPAWRFQWPRVDGLSLYSVVLASLTAMSESHCCYCDGHPMDSVGDEQIDHFRPKSVVEFQELVCTWENLFLTCMACNKAKREQWDDLLLRPDDGEYSFERYFQYNASSGALSPNDAAPDADRARAEATIQLLDLNRSGACLMRRRTVRLAAALTPEERLDLPYRYLLPLCLSAGT
jgi:uncharacterized protein (TIGR02646 family)